MSRIRGFTLIEVLISAGILVCGLVGVASMFSFVIRTNGMNRQMAVATTLLYNKMEEFRSASLSDPNWVNTTGSETITVAGQEYVMVWATNADTPRTVTVIVYAAKNALTRRQAELIRASTLVSPKF